MVWDQILLQSNPLIAIHLMCHSIPLHTAPCPDISYYNYTLFEYIVAVDGSGCAVVMDNCCVIVVCLFVCCLFVCLLLLYTGRAVFVHGADVALLPTGSAA